MNSFEKKVFLKIKKIPKGRVSTYSLVASAIGNKKAHRAVGNALKKNKDIPGTPCHRVVRSDACVGGYALGANKKKKILKEEGVLIKDNKIINFKKLLFNFK